MSTVLEEKIPMVHHYLVEQYAQFSQSAVDTVARGLKSAASMGISSSAQDSIGNFELEGLGGPDTSQMLGPLIGTKISEAALVASPEEAFQGRFKGSEKSNQAELNAFAKNVFGDGGLLRSLGKQGIIIHGSQAQQKGFIFDVSKTAMNQAELEGSLEAKGFVIYGSENPQSASGIVGPEYTTMNEMEQTLQKTLKLQQDLQKFNSSVKA